jgi:ribosomal subunit interface protein
MEIDIQASNLSLTRDLREHIKRRLGFALSNRYERIRRILVRLSDINGPRGGNDKRCLIQVVLPRQADVVIEDTESSLYAAIDRAAERVSQTVKRRLARSRHKGRARPVYDDQLPDGTERIDFPA